MNKGGCYWFFMTAPDFLLLWKLNSNLAYKHLLLKKQDRKWGCSKNSFATAHSYFLFTVMLINKHCFCLVEVEDIFILHEYICLIHSVK